MHTFSLALVTGATSGIGKALCAFLADQGIDLLVTGRNTDHLNALVTTLSPKVDVIAVPADLATTEGCAEVIKMIQAHVPDLVINNAGFGLYGEALRHTTQQQLEMLDVNGKAVLALSLEAARTMKDAGKKGVILNVSSIAGFLTFPHFAVYAASKGFVAQFSEAFDFEMRSYGIRVLTSCPGVVSSEFRKRAGGKRGKGWAMSREFAVQEIWRQIQNEKVVHIFDWRYRLATFFCRFFLPKKWSAQLLASGIDRLLYH